MSIFLNLRINGKLKPHQFFYTWKDFCELYLHHQQAIEDEDYYIAQGIASARNKIFHRLHDADQQRPEVVK